jgi:(p)ppGpp synthase/HD superfamily hydrolase
MINLPTADETDAFVLACHAGQFDKLGVPYIEHVRAVAFNLRSHGEWAYMAGLLHDVVEDCEVELAALYDMGYPDIVVEAVDAVSRRDDALEGAYENYDAFVLRASQHPLGCLVKLSDNLHNSSELRLQALPEATAIRLRDKYARAREVLVPALRRHRQQGELVFGPKMVSLGVTVTGR